MATPSGKMKGTVVIAIAVPVWLLHESCDASALVHLVDIDVRDAKQHVDDLNKILSRGVSEGTFGVAAVILEHSDIHSLLKDAHEVS